MIEIIDNLGYSGPKPNFDRDTMTYDQMLAVTNDDLDIGHIVYCSTEQYKGSYRFLGHGSSFSNSWDRVITNSINPFKYNGNGTGVQTQSGNASGANGVAINSGTASGSKSMAENEGTAQGESSHAEGKGTAAGKYSHAEGNGTSATGIGAHAEGKGTITNNEGEHAQGTYNKSNSNTLHSIGIGTSNSARKNAEELLKSGLKYLLGLGGYDGTNPSDSTDVASFVNDLAQKVADQIFTMRYDETNGDVYILCDVSNTMVRDAYIDQVTGDVIVNLNI